MDTYQELKEKNVEFIPVPFAKPTGTGNWRTTIKDPEGNILQFYGAK